MTESRSFPFQVEKLLQRMSLPEKVGQIMMMAFAGPEVSEAVRQLIQECHVGGVILYQITGNLETPQQILQLTQGCQALAQIPLLIGIDEEGGTVRRLPDPATAFPSAMTLGSTDDPKLARQMGQGIAEELRALGISVNFAPVVDVNSNPRNPIIGTRAFGSDPDQVIRLGQAMVEGHRQAGVIPTLKHFPGHGDTAIDSHLGLPRIERGGERLQQVELRPFQALIERGVEMVMTAHVVVPGLGSGDLPATLSSQVLEGWLRQRLGFDGVIITDSLTMGALDQTWGAAEAAERSLRAGADLLLFGADQGHDLSEGRSAYDHLLNQVRTGAISEDRLNESVARILHLKARYGLLDPLDHQQSAGNLEPVGCEEHRRLAERIAAASITIVKQQDNLIPLSRDRSLLVIYPQSRGDLASVLSQYHPQVHSSPLSLDPQPEEIQPAQDQAADCDQILVATYDAWKHPDQVTLVRSLPQDKLVVAAIGSPYDLQSFPEICTYVVTYGDLLISLSALAQVLLGEIPAQGKLPIQL